VLIEANSEAADIPMEIMSGILFCSCEDIDRCWPAIEGGGIQSLWLNNVNAFGLMVEPLKNASDR
jgi:hypothetical protein